MNHLFLLGLFLLAVFIRLGDAVHWIDLTPKQLDFFKALAHCFVGWLFGVYWGRIEEAKVRKLGPYFGTKAELYIHLALFLTGVEIVAFLITRFHH